MKVVLILLVSVLVSSNFDSKATNSKPIQVQFYGLHLSFDVPDCFDKTVAYYNFEELHEKYEREISKNDISLFLSQLHKAEQQYNITDRFLLQVVAHIAKQTTANRNYQQLMTWCLSKRLSYTVAIGLKDGQYYFLPAYQEDLEGLSFFRSEGTKYYVDNLINDEVTPGASLGVYPYIGGKKAFYLPPILPSVQAIPNTRLLNFYFKGKQYQINLQYDYSRVAMYYGLPGLPVNSYLSSSLSETLRKSLHQQLDPIISRFNKEDAVSFILTMVQYGMPYRTDGEQMGEEKYFLPDEFLHYHFSDCEDKSIFFKKVIEELLQIETKILVYGNHVGPVVNLNTFSGQNAISINGKPFYYCETTGKGYTLGQLPDQFKQLPPEEWK